MFIVLERLAFIWGTRAAEAERASSAHTHFEHERDVWKHRPVDAVRL